jgi:hypothetical protein
LALLAVALCGVVAWVVWPTERPAITAAKANYARLQPGMSGQELVAILGGPPPFKGQLYGQWRDELQWYETTVFIRAENASPPPGHKLYDWFEWDFGDTSGLGATTHKFSVAAMLDGDRVVALWCFEKRSNILKRLLQELAQQISVSPPFLDDISSRDRKAIPP